MNFIEHENTIMKKSLLLILWVACAFNYSNAQNYYRTRKLNIPIIDTASVSISSCTLSPDSSTYFTTTLGLYRYNHDSCSSVNFPLSLNYPPTSMCFKTANNYWVGSDSGLYHWDGITWSIFDSLNTPFFRSSIKAVYSNPVSGKSYFYSNGIIGNHHSQLCIFDGATWTSIDSTNSLLPTPLPNVDVDDLGNIFVNAYDTIGIYDGINWQFISAYNLISPSGLQMDIFTGLKSCGMGKCFFTGYNAAAAVPDDYVIKYSPGSPLKFLNSSLPNWPEKMHTLCIDKLGNLWYRIEGSNHYSTLIKYDGLSFKYFTYGAIDTTQEFLTVDFDNDIWINAAEVSQGFRLYNFNEDGHNYISGNVFFDNDSNGIQGPDESNVKNLLVHETTKNLYTNTDISGYVLGLNDTSGTYNIELVIPSYYHVNPFSYTINQTHNNQKDSAFNFGIIPNGILTDLAINGFIGNVRRGCNSFINITCRNVSTTFIGDTVSVSLDSNLSYVNAFPAPTFINGNFLQWVFINYPPFYTSGIFIEAYASTSLANGDTVNVVGSVGTSLIDTTPSNNTIVLSRKVWGSYDPNIKEVEPKGTGTSGNVPLHQQLSYTIQFQNTGNDTAFKVVVKDSIDSDLDLSTFNLVASSHPFSYKINSERLVTFTFDNILLPDSTTNELMSHGFIKYTISPLPNAVSGQQVKNVAGIYFDYNSAVATNTTLNTLSLAAGIPSVNYESTKAVAYPNPFTNQTTIRLATTKLNYAATQLKIYDLTGRDVTSQSTISAALYNGETYWTLKSNSLAGMFIYKITEGNKQLASGKITIQ